MAELVRADPLGLLLSLRDRLAGAASGMKLDASSGAYVSTDGRSRLLLARPRRPPFDTEFAPRPVRAARDDRARSGARARRVGDDTPPPRIRFAGGHAIALEMEGLMRGESIWNAIGALVVILPLLYFAFRSPWLVAVGAVPSALSVLIVMAAYAWLGIPLSAAAAGAAAMQFGLGIDGVVLLFVAYRHVGRVVSDDGRERSRRARREHAARHVDDGGDVLRPGGRGLPQPRGARPADRPQHDGLRRADAGARAGAAAARRRRPCPRSRRGWLPRLVVRRRALILGAAA